MENVAVVLKEIKAKAAAEAAILATEDGLVLEGITETDLDLDVVAAYAANYVSVSASMAEDVQFGQTESVIVVYRGKCLVIAPLGSSLMAVLVGAGSANVGNLRLQLWQRIEDLARAVQQEVPEMAHSADTVLSDGPQFSARIDEELGRAQGQQTEFSVAVMALERLEAAGPVPENAQEWLLRLFAMRLQKAIRFPADVVARLDDGKFGVLLAGVKRDKAVAVVQRIAAQALHDNLDHPRDEVTFRLRAGIASFPEAGSSAESLLQQAAATLEPISA